MSRKTFKFDGGFTQSGGLTFSHSRSAASVDPSGTAVAANRPVYDRTGVLAGAAAPVTVRTSGGNCNVLDTDYRKDSTTPVTVFAANNEGRMHFYVNGDPATTGTLDPYMDTFAGSATSTRSATAKSNMTGAGQLVTEDFFSHAQATSAVVPNYSTEAWMTRSFVVYKGAIVGLMNIATTGDATNWSSSVKDKIGLVLGNAETIAAAPTSARHTWFSQAAKSDDLTADTGPETNFGNHWALSKWVLDGAGAYDFWVGIVDYANDPDKDRGLVGIMRVRSTDSGVTWTAGKVRILYEFSGLSNTGHTHAVVIVRKPGTTKGIRVIFSRGDERPNQAILVCEHEDEDHYDDGNSLATLSDAGTNWMKYSSGTNDWTTATVVSGWVNATDLTADQPNRRIADQFVGVAPDTTSGFALVGADEQNGVINRFEVTGPTTPLVLETVEAVQQPIHVTPVSGADPTLNARRNVAFNIDAASHNPVTGPFACISGVGANELEVRRLARTRVSPNGRHWCPAWLTRQKESTTVKVRGNQLHMGAFGNAINDGWRKTNVSTVLARPLLIGSGATNYANITSSPAAGDAVNVTLSSMNPAIPSPMTIPPSVVQRYFRTAYLADGSSGSPRIWSWDVSTTVPNPVGDRCRVVCVHLQIMNDRPENWTTTPSSSALQLKFRLDIRNATDNTNEVVGGYTGPVFITDHGHWQDVYIYAYVPAFATSSNGPQGYKTSGNTDLAIKVRCETGNGVPLPSHFYTALVGCYAFPTSAEGLPSLPIAGGGTTTTADTAEVGSLGMDTGINWAVSLHTKIPKASPWDDQGVCAFSGAATITSATQCTFSVGTSLSTTAGDARPGQANFYQGMRVRGKVGSTAMSTDSGKRITASTYDSGTGLVTLTIDGSWDNSLTSGSAAIYIGHAGSASKKRPIATIGATDQTEGVTFFAYTMDPDTGDGDPADALTSVIEAAVYTGGAYGSTIDVDVLHLDGDFAWLPGDPIQLSVVNLNGDLFIYASACGSETESGVLFGMGSAQTKTWDKLFLGRRIGSSAVTPLQVWGGVVETDVDDADAFALNELKTLGFQIGGSGSYPTTFPPARTSGKPQTRFTHVRR